MVDHIYGRINILNAVKRSNMFVNELKMYVDYLENEIEKNIHTITANKSRQLRTFQTNLLKGIEYYHTLTASIKNEATSYIDEMKAELTQFEQTIANLTIPAEVKAVLA